MISAIVTRLARPRRCGYCRRADGVHRLPWGITACRSCAGGAVSRLVLAEGAVAEVVEEELDQTQRLPVETMADVRDHWLAARK